MCIMNGMRIIRIIRPGLAGMLVFLALSGSCSLQLKEEPAVPRWPIEGLWRDNSDDREEDDIFRLLYISSPGAENYPYRFEYIQYYRRDLMLSGKRLVFVRRNGNVVTSPTEALFYRTEFVAGYRPNLSEGDGVWPFTGFAPEVIDRRIQTQETFDLFELTGDGDQLIGDEYQFERVLPTPGTESVVAELDIGFVMSVSPEGEIVMVTFSPVLAVIGEQREVWSPDGKTATVRVTDKNGELVAAQIVSGSAEIGQAVVMPGFQLNQTYQRELTREEILEKLQRGEPVSREDLIRVLGDQ